MFGIFNRKTAPPAPNVFDRLQDAVSDFLSGPDLLPVVDAARLVEAEGKELARLKAQLNALDDAGFSPDVAASVTAAEKVRDNRRDVQFRWDQQYQARKAADERVAAEKSKAAGKLRARLDAVAAPILDTLDLDDETQEREDRRIRGTINGMVRNFLDTDPPRIANPLSDSVTLEATGTVRLHGPRGTVVLHDGDRGTVRELGGEQFVREAVKQGSLTVVDPRTPRRTRGELVNPFPTVAEPPPLPESVPGNAIVFILPGRSFSFISPSDGKQYRPREGERFKASDVGNHAAVESMVANGVLGVVGRNNDPPPTANPTAPPAGSVRRFKTGW